MCGASNLRPKGAISTPRATHMKRPAPQLPPPLLDESQATAPPAGIPPVSQLRQGAEPKASSVASSPRRHATLWRGVGRSGRANRYGAGPASRPHRAPTAPCLCRNSPTERDQSQLKSRASDRLDVVGVCMPTCASRSACALRNKPRQVGAQGRVRHVGHLCGGAPRAVKQRRATSLALQ